MLYTFQKYYVANAIPKVLHSWTLLQMREEMEDLRFF